MSPPTTGPAPETTQPLTPDWLADPRLARLLAALDGHGEAIWVVGGAVRNTLLGVPVADIDLATTATPDAVIARAKAAQLKPVPTGIDHGTITVVVAGTPFEVTTLRADVKTHGRRATVAFGRDWSADAHRRDFTVNALYLSPDGVVHDFVGGIADCAARRIRFIGDAHQRIREDYLRILRFFRFHATYAHGAPDPHGLAACAAHADGLKQLSAERIGQEMKKLVVAPRAGETVQLMAAHGLLAPIIAAATPARLQAVAGRLDPLDKSDAPLLLAALSAEPAALAKALRLSNAEAARMVTACAAATEAAKADTAPALRRLAYRHGATGARDGLILAAADLDLPREQLAEHLALIRRFAPGPAPVRGRDLTALGLTGPSVGEATRRAEQLWIDSDFSLDRAALLAALGLKPAD